jgi:hypothetical protein
LTSLETGRSDFSPAGFRIRSAKGFPFRHPPLFPCFFPRDGSFRPFRSPRPNRPAGTFRTSLLFVSSSFRLCSESFVSTGSSERFPPSLRSGRRRRFPTPRSSPPRPFSG